MAALEVNLKLLLQLQAMDFPFARAAQALHSTRNVSIEAAVNWIIDHENDPSIDQAPSLTFDVDIESSSTIILSEEMRKKTKKLMERVQMNEAKKERHQKEERRRDCLADDQNCKDNFTREDGSGYQNMELIKEEKSSKEKIRQTLEQDKAKRRSKFELLDEILEPIKRPFTIDKEEEKSSREKIPRKLEQDEAKQRNKFELLDEILEPIKRPFTIDKEEEKSSREKIPRKLEQDKPERRSKVKLLDERPEPIKRHFTSSLPSTMSSKKAECMRECLKSLKQNYKDDIYIVRRAFQTLLIYVGNVAKHPDNEKFRKIRLTNPIFQERVGSLKGGIEFLEVCGFERREGGFLYLPPHKVDVNSLKSAGFLLNSALSNPFFGVLSH